MYTRKLSKPPEKLIINGKPIFGTFAGIPPDLDIRGVTRPFGVLPLPTFITDLRIRSSLFFVFHTEEYTGIIDFFDARIFGHVEVIIWNKQSGRKFAYRTVTGPRKRLIPKKTTAGVCAALRNKRYIRVGWDTARNCLSAIFNLSGDDVRPDASAAFNAALDSPQAATVAAVLPAPVMRRCRAVWLLTAPMTGNLTLHDTYAMQQAKTQNAPGSVLFKSARAYYKIRTKKVSALGTGTIQGKNISFSITSANFESVNPDTYNENILFSDGKVTPLPPVKITYPFGITGKWVIQDTENMVDLSFTPVSDHSRTLSIFILRTQNHSIYGTFDGIMQTTTGESIILKDFPGIVRKQMVRL